MSASARERAGRLVLACVGSVSMTLGISCGDAPTTPTGPSRWTLSVTVLADAGGQPPVANATVTVLDGPDAGRKAITGEAGVAILADLTAAAFSVEVTAEAYERATSAVTQTSAQTITVRLKPKAGNAPPVIASILAQGSRPNEPAAFADRGEEIAVTATITDAETPVTGLDIEWSSDVGAISGTGPSVRWRAPASARTPSTATLTLVVVERFTAADESGQVVPREHRVTGTTTVRVHDSAREVGDLSMQFLADFSNSDVLPAEVVRGFSDGCRGKWEELSDVQNNRNTYTIVSSKLGTPSVSVSFGGTCPFRARAGDACATVSCEWVSLVKATNKTETAKGTDHIAAVYQGGRWWLCNSDFQSASPVSPLFIR